MKTRLTRNCTNGIFHRLLKSRDRKAYIWAMNLKPGDVFNSYDSNNHRVKTIKTIWVKAAEHAPYIKSEKQEKKTGKLEGRKVNGEFVYDVNIISTDGMSHSISEEGCIVPAYTKEELALTFGSKQLVDALIDFGFLDSEGALVEYLIPETESHRIYSDLIEKFRPETEGKEKQFIKVYYPTITNKTRKRKQ